MKIKPFETNNFIDSVTPFKNPILLYGPDDGLILNRTSRIVKSFLGKDYNKSAIVSFDFKDKKSLDLLNVLNTSSLLSEKEVLKIYNTDDKIINILNLDNEFNGSDNLLIIINAGDLLPRSKLRKYFEEKKDFAVIPCYKTDLPQLKEMIIKFALKNNLEIEDAAIEYLCASLGQDYQIILNELDKLILLNKKKISYDMIKNLITLNKSLPFEDLIFSCFEGNKQKFTKKFNEVIDDYYTATSFIFATKNLLLIIGKAINFYNKKNIDQVVLKYMPKYLFKKKYVFQDIVKNTKNDNILKCLNIIGEVELKIRESQYLYKIILHRAMLNISQKMK